MDVYSEVGIGTTLKVYLPGISGGTAMAAAASDLTDIYAGQETVLVVEDEAPVRMLIVMILRAAGYTVLEAGNGAQGIEMARDFEGPIHLLC